MFLVLDYKNYNYLHFNISEHAHLASQDGHVHLTSQKTHILSFNISEIGISQYHNLIGSLLFSRRI